MQKMSELFFLALPPLVEFLWKLPLNFSFFLRNGFLFHFEDILTTT